MTESRKRPFDRFWAKPPHPPFFGRKEDFRHVKDTDRVAEHYETRHLTPKHRAELFQSIFQASGDEHDVDWKRVETL